VKAPHLAALHLARELQRGATFDMCAWQHRWVWWSVVLVIIGAAISISGAAISIRRPWGYLLFALIMGLAATSSWVQKLCGLVQYRYEEPNIWESLVYVALCLIALRSYRVSSRRLGA